MRYIILARLVRAFLILGIIMLSLGTFLKLRSIIFDVPAYIKIAGWKYGNIEEGYKLPMHLSLSVPDTVISYKNGGIVISSAIPDHFENKFKKLYRDSVITKKIVNKLEILDSKYPISISNRITFDGNAFLNFDSKHKFYTVFWGFYGQLHVLILISLFVLLIKLINIYLKGNFLMKRSFKLITFVGVLLISAEVFEMIFIYINAKIIPSVNLSTQSIVGEYVPNGVHLSFNLGSSVSFSNIGIGIMIIML